MPKGLVIGLYSIGCLAMLIGVEEGSVRVLQKEGWLHSGYVEWRTPYTSFQRLKP